MTIPAVRKRRALVTGATGFIGGHLVEHLRAQAYDVRCLVRPTSDVRHLQAQNVECLLGDLTQPESLDASVRGVEVVFHLAGITAASHQQAYFDDNARATEHLVSACLRGAADTLQRLIFVSSLAAAGPSPDGRPLLESQPCRPVSPYGKSKLAAERAVWRATHVIPVTVVRPPIVYGPRDRDIFKFFAMVKSGLVAHIGHRRRYVSMVHVHDLVRGIARAADCAQAAGQCYYLANQQYYSRQEVAGYMARGLGLSALRQISVPEGVWYAAALVMELLLPLVRDPSLLSRETVWEAVQDYWICDPAKAQRELDWQATIPIDEGMRQTACWYREQGWL